MPVPVYFVIHSVDDRRGGLTRSALHRARLYAERTGQTVDVLSLNFNPDYDDVRERLLELGLITDRVRIRNVFEEIASAESAQASAHPVPELAAPDVPSAGIESGEGLREYRDRHGRIRRVELLDEQTGTPRETRLYSPLGQLFCRIDWDPSASPRTSTSVTFFDGDGRTTARFPHQTALFREWLVKVAGGHGMAVLQTEYSSTDRIVRQIREPDIATVKVLHKNHLAAPYRYGAPLAEDARVELQQPGSYDALVFLTEDQLRDASRQLGPRTTYHAVPHAVPTIQLNDRPLRDPLLAVAVGRYHPPKRWDHAIRAFGIAQERVPGAHFELWGFGQQEESLRELVRELGLGDTVSVNGIANAPEVFAKAAFSVLSSPSEGFPLAPLESMAVGTPVLSYRINYGVCDQIIDGVDGKLVEEGDIPAMAEAMVELFEDPELCRKMGEQAKCVVERFSQEHCMDRWLAVYEAAVKQVPQRVQMPKPACAATSAEFSRVGLKLSGVLDFGCRIEDLAVKLYARHREKLVDVYLPCSIRETPSGLLFETSAPFSVLEAEPGTVWDLSLSCQAHNAHRFARIGAPSELPSRVTHHRFVYGPYTTKSGTLSVRVSAAAPLARRLRAALWRRVRRVAAAFRG